MRVAARKFAPDLDILQIPIDPDDEGAIEQAIATLKRSNYQFFFAVVLSTESHDALLTEAVKQGVAGTGTHNWFFADFFRTVLDDRALEVGSPLQRAYRGAGMFSVGSAVGEMKEIFDSKMIEIKNPDDKKFLDAIVPDLEKTQYFDAEWFLNPIEFEYTHFFYEAAILAGLAACEAVDGSNLTLTGKSLYRTIVNYKIDKSLTGSLRLDNTTGTRIPDSTFTKLTNFIEHIFVDPDSGKAMVSYKLTTTHKYHEGQWTDLVPFIYNDGTTNLPPGIPAPETNPNYIDTAVRAIAYSLFGVAVILAIVFATWTWRNRTIRVIRASQPFFLYLICAGCVLLACSIVPLGIDHSISTIRGCEIACNSTVWLVSMGFAVIFSSLFSKTHRINKIMKNSKKFKRISVSIRDTLKPAIALLTGKK
jgi:7 transmembrane sweet-taste receptor of 3 GCPR